MEGTTMFKMIRASVDYEIVLLVSPADADLNSPNKKYYHYKHQLGKQGVFNEISSQDAIKYFSRQSDGMGWGELREELFTSLEEAVQYVEAKRLEVMKEMRREFGLPEEVTDEQHQENLRILREIFKKDRESKDKK